MCQPNRQFVWTIFPWCFKVMCFQLLHFLYSSKLIKIFFLFFLTRLSIFNFYNLKSVQNLMRLDIHIVYFKIMITQSWFLCLHIRLSFQYLDVGWDWIRVTKRLLCSNPHVGHQVSKSKVHEHRAVHIQKIEVRTLSADPVRRHPMFS